MGSSLATVTVRRASTSRSRPRCSATTSTSPWQRSVVSERAVVFTYVSTVTTIGREVCDLQQEEEVVVNLALPDEVVAFVGPHRLHARRQLRREGAT